ncbi:uncharacterized protein LOC123708468 [Pieris brassicae]|uniref:uncharacterized protein LOC123708468 n=1 Tax=Pieris brassicae TaxID=7116 RepID=UPI001E660F00|nr:uncharacterized protein LOC123708468 [Pieris brassicae]
MDWFVMYLVIATLVVVKGYKSLDLENLIDLVRRRSILSDDEILGVPKYVEHLPRAEKILPGHTLLKPSFGMLKSAVKFPQRSLSNNVYGNINNIGIAFGNTNERVRYTDFRKTENVMAAIVGAIKNIKSKTSPINNPVVIEFDRTDLPLTKEPSENFRNFSIQDENGANEILDDANSLFTDGNVKNERRSRKIKSAYRIRQSSESTASSDVSQSSASSDYEKNAGNPFTIHKDKYKQNWLWNHQMDGDHMNVNPYAPIFQNYGPSGSSLFFGRKWWYYNQDDFKPME